MPSRAVLIAKLKNVLRTFRADKRHNFNLILSLLKIFLIDGQLINPDDPADIDKSKSP